MRISTTVVTAAAIAGLSPIAGAQTFSISWHTIDGGFTVTGGFWAGPVGDSCVGDFNGDGTANTHDVLAFLNDWVAGEQDADVNGDGGVDTRDVLAFLNLWNAGC